MDGTLHTFSFFFWDYYLGGFYGEQQEYPFDGIFDHEHLWS